MFPNVKNKKFVDINTNRQVSVIDQFENIAILDNKQKVDVNRLLDRNFFDQYIDPKEFFNESNLSVFTEKIKSIPNDVLNQMEDTSVPYTEYDPEEEKRILLEKANRMTNTNINQAMNQMDKFRQFLDPEDEIQMPTPLPQGDTSVRIVEDVNNSPRPFIQPNPSVTSPKEKVKTEQFVSQPQPVQQPNDPMISMFKNIKRNQGFNVNIKIDGKIPRPDFIEMMEDSYEVSIIDYLADEFTNKLLSDPSFIRNKIKEEINKVVYGNKAEKSTTKVEKTNTTKTKVLQESDNPTPKVRRSKKASTNVSS